MELVSYRAIGTTIKVNGVLDEVKRKFVSFFYLNLVSSHILSKFLKNNLRKTIIFTVLYVVKKMQKHEMLAGLCK
jgi:hypothetical protein